MPFLNEATYCLQEGAASASEIDAAVRRVRHADGAFTLLDMVGLDVCCATWAMISTRNTARAWTPTSCCTGCRKLAGWARSPARASTATAGKTMSTSLKSRPTFGEIGQPVHAGAPHLPVDQRGGVRPQEHIAIRRRHRHGDDRRHRHELQRRPQGPAGDRRRDRAGRACWKDWKTCQKQYGERFRPARLLRTKVSAGHLGVKAGRGFHEYA